MRFLLLLSLTALSATKGPSDEGLVIKLVKTWKKCVADNEPCKNGAKCIARGGNYSCHCPNVVQVWNDTKVLSPPKISQNCSWAVPTPVNEAFPKNYSLLPTTSTPMPAPGASY